jgi:hypothetical protein
MIVVIDEPTGLEIHNSQCKIRGWCAFPVFRPGWVRFEVGGIPVRSTSERRPDAEAAHPGATVRGFMLHLDLTYYMRAIRDSELHLKVSAGDGEESSVRFQISRAALGTCMAAASGL